jgi:hypothetical protein
LRDREKEREFRSCERKEEEEEERRGVVEDFVPSVSVMDKELMFLPALSSSTS